MKHACNDQYICITEAYNYGKQSLSNKDITVLLKMY